MRVGALVAARARHQAGRPEALLDAVFRVYRWDALDHGGYGMDRRARDVFLTQTTPEELGLVVTWVRTALPSGGLVPLQLEDVGPWDPSKEYWGEKGGRIDPCLLPVLAAGKRPAFETEQVVSGVDWCAFEPDDPILDAVACSDRGDRRGARAILHGLLERNLWRLGLFDETRDVFERILWYNPTDNQGVRFILPTLERREPWRDEDG
ncbi:MAG: hypothetical protein JXB39_15510 [Deltaproteobacteria bacterium]|nr:hypothetical protein [Deltaproteobacteria bacterium]